MTPDKTPSEAELLPCPFCGEAAKHSFNSLYGDMSMASCKSCGATAYAPKWNRRAVLAKWGTPAPVGVGEVAERYRNAIASACEGWTMPDGLRKHLETALWSPPTPQPTQPQAGAVPLTDEYPALVCDYCGALTPDPWHSSGMLHGKMSKHIHSCDACASHGQAPAQPATVHCKGRNCAAVDGDGHSDECASDHERAASGLDTAGNRNPVARYDGYRGAPCNPAYTKDQRAAWLEGYEARNRQGITPTSGAADLRTAAQAVVDRWDTPLWKDVPATAEYIGRLRAALAAGQATEQSDSVQEDAARLDWLEQNLFHREKDEWDTKFGGYKEYNMWVLFSPKGIQGRARDIIDAARKQGETQ